MSQALLGLQISVQKQPTVLSGQNIVELYPEFMHRMLCTTKLDTSIRNGRFTFEITVEVTFLVAESVST